MNLFRLIALPAAGVVAVASLTGSAHAQTARTGGSANTQLLQQMQQLASERTSLQAENAQMKKELDALRKERDALKKGQQAVDGRVKATEVALARTTAQHESTEQELKQAKDRMQELVAKFRETIQTLRDVESERATAKQALTATDHDLKVCVDHNAALYKLNEEVLNRLEHPGWSRVASIEPFTKIKRVQLENLVDDYKSRAEDQRLKTAPPAAGQPRPGVPAPQIPPAATAPVATAPASTGSTQAAPTPRPPSPSQNTPPAVTNPAAVPQPATVTDHSKGPSGN
jgi:hypothetical protein